MPMYTYETIPAKPGTRVRRFECFQSIHDAPLQHAPETGEPVRRVITGGIVIRYRGVASVSPSDCCPGCHE
jgi:predicted nucleic acid-binding Zn ribbon protein